MARTIRWGILGLGSIAHSFATGLTAVPDAVLAAVGSRSVDKAKAFATQHKATRAYGSYEELAKDPEVDAIYIATPHNLHKANTIMCLEAKKAVLCEKPFAINAKESEEMIACARRLNIPLMEAMWTRFLPVMGQVRQWLARGAIGEPRMLTADFGFRAGFDPKGRHFDAKLAGGALLDVGVYTIALASMVFKGKPARIASMADIGASGIDEQSAFLFGYDKGQLALLSCAVRTNTPHEARIDGTSGSIRIPYFWKATSATLHVDGKEAQTATIPFSGNGYNYEAEAFGNMVRAGELENTLIPLDETLAIQRTMDEIRRQWNMVYPMETASGKGAG